MKNNSLSRFQSRLFVVLVAAGLIFQAGFAMPVMASAPAVPASAPQSAFGTCAGVSGITSADCQALVDLYNSAGGAAWTVRTNWLQDNTPCDWYGVLCASNRVITLGLSHNNLVGSLATTLGNLTQLTNLDLSYNQLSGSIPTTLGSLTGLNTLYLNNNQLSGSIPAQLGSLANLKTLTLIRNQLSGAFPATFILANLPSLTTLTVDCWITSADPSVITFIATFLGSGWQLTRCTQFTNCTAVTTIPTTECNALVALFTSTGGATLWTTSDGWLYLGDPCLWYAVSCTLSHVTSLNLSNNGLQGTLPTALGGLTQLSYLNLGNNGLTGSIPVALGSMTQISYLNLGNNLLTGSIPTQVGSLTQLRYLYLNNITLTGTIPSGLGALTQLVWLDLSNSHLSGTIPSGLGTPPQLSHLDLSHNQLTGAIPSGLGSPTQLNWLDLSNNQLSGSIPTDQGTLAQLSHLDLSNNQLTGTLPALGGLTSLTWMDVSFNKLGGDIPASITSLSGLLLPAGHLGLSCGLTSSDTLSVIPFVNVLVPGWLNNRCVTVITSHNPNPSDLAQLVTVAVTVGGTVTPTGTVHVTGADAPCDITLSAGAGSCTVSFSTYGAKTITAVYTNSGNTMIGSSASVAHTAADNHRPVVSAFSAPSFSSSLTIPITDFTATDNIGVTGYLITTSSAVPAAGAAGWVASAPTTFTVAAQGLYSLYPWAKDGTGNVSAVYASPVSVTVDTTAPVVSAFTVTSPSTTLNIPITSFTASDAVGVTGYMITQTSTAPLASDPAWVASVPTSYAVGAAGNYVLYPWARDAAGNVSAVYGSPANVTVTANSPVPVVTTFTATSPSVSLTIPITAFTASGGTGVTGYMITQSSTAPLAGDPAWVASAPTTYLVTADGVYTLYPWAKDAAGNVSTVFGSPASVTVDTTAPTVNTFNVIAFSPSLNIPIAAFTATDAVGVTGYMITQSSTAPAAGAAGWIASAPTTYTVAAEASYTLYPWAKNAVGIVSAVFGSPANVTVNTHLPAVTTFSATSPTNSFNIPITAFTAAGGTGITGYMITQSPTAPAVGDPAWVASVPTTYTVAAVGSYTLYPWAKDGAGNVSAVFSLPVTVIVDTQAPTVNTFNSASFSATLNIPITAFTASDNIAVTGYMITQTSIAPAAGVAGWVAAAPTTYTVAADGSYTLYPWAKDGAGNVSAVFGSPASATVNTHLPSVASFSATSPTNSLNIPINAFTASGGTGGITGYMITLSSTAPGAGDPAWVASAPTTYAVAADGNYILYPWAKDAAGNVSLPFGSPVSVQVDTHAPTVTTFGATSPVNSLTIPIIAFTATDNVGVTGYMITLSATVPAAADPTWVASAPTTYAVAAAGSYTLYPWAKDGAGNVSAVFGSPASVTVTTSLGIERIKNGGFNLYRGAGKIPLNWVAVNFKTTDGKDGTTAHEGVASVKISGTPGKIKTLTQTLALSGAAGNSFTLSFWTKGRAIAGRGVCSAQVILYWGSVATYTKTVNCAIGTYPAFRKTTVSFINPTYPYTKVVIKLTYAKTSGTIWFDAISLMR